MKFSHAIEEDICIIFIEENLIAEKASEIKKTIAFILDKKSTRGFVLNCEKIEAIDPSGIAVFILIFKILERNQKRLAICHLSPEILKKLSHTHLDKVLSIYSTEKEALASFQ